MYWIKIILISGYISVILLITTGISWALPQTLFESIIISPKNQQILKSTFPQDVPSLNVSQSPKNQKLSIPALGSAPKIVLKNKGESNSVAFSLIQLTLDDGSKVLSISLRDVVERTLKSNIAIAVQDFQSKIKKEEIIEKKAEFDHNLSGEFNANSNRRQLSSTFSEPNVTDDLNHLWQVGVNKKFVTGTEYEVTYEAQRDTTNSLFSGLNPQYSSELILKITQPLLKGFGIDTNKKDIYIANNNLDISDYEFRDKVIEIVADAENIYWDLVFSIDDLKVKQQSIERARELEKRVKAQVEVGVLAPLEILQARSEVASREESVLDAEKSIQDNEDKIKNIINIPFDSADGNKNVHPLDRPKFVINQPVNLDESVKLALTQRPDYLIMKKELDNKKILVKYNENQTYPSLDLVGSFGLNGISGNAVAIPELDAGSSKSEFGGNFGHGVENMFNWEYRTWGMGFSVNYPLGNRAAKSRLSVSRLEVSQMLLDIKDKERNIILEVREAVRQINTDIKRVHAAKLSRQLAEEKLNAEEKKFEVGLSTSFQVLEFQTDLAEEQTNELQAVVDYNKSHIKLRKIIASTLDEYNIRLVGKSSQ